MVSVQIASEKRPGRRLGANFSASIDFGRLRPKLAIERKQWLAAGRTEIGRDGGQIGHQLGGNQGQEREGNTPVVPIEGKRGREALSSQPPARLEALPPDPVSSAGLLSGQARPLLGPSLSGQALPRQPLPSPAKLLLLRPLGSALGDGQRRRFASRFDRVGVKAPPHRFKTL